MPSPKVTYDPEAWKVGGLTLMRHFRADPNVLPDVVPQLSYANRRRFSRAAPVRIRYLVPFLSPCLDSSTPTVQTTSMKTNSKRCDKWWKMAMVHGAIPRRT